MLKPLHYPICALLLFFGMINCTGSKSKTQNSPIAQKTAQSGKAIYTTHCISCHALEQEEIGPKLGGVTNVLSTAELVAFIKNPNAAIEAGNKRAVSLTKRYKMIMPPFDFLKDDEIKSILSYIAEETNAHNIKPLQVNVDESAGTAERLAKPVIVSGLEIETEDFVTIPASSEKMPRTRIANMRPGPERDGSLFVSDQRGLIYKIKDGKAGIFLDIRPLVQDYINEPGLGTGLGSFAFHPGYLENGLIYITHTEAFKGKKADYEYADSVKVFLQWVVSEWKINDVKSSTFEGNRRELLRINVPGNVHGTQDIGFVPEIDKSDKDYGMLYIGTGDGGSTISGHPELCHDLHSLLGTIIRIDPLGKNSRYGNYGIPTDNPFVNNADPEVRKEIYAFGFRNPHRMSWNVTHGRKMFSTEVGESNFEEVNIIEKGGDYGWNIQEGNYGISPKDLKNVFKLEKPSPTFIKPYALYDHLDGAAISGGAVYEGDIAALKNKYLFGDIVSGRIFFTNVDKTLSDSTVHELSIIRDGKDTNLREMTGSRRVDLRIEYDAYTKNLYIMTKSDGKIRKVTAAHLRKTP
ncbi:PQQ-dependent sugar dehydrogenase [Dyadobacter psychrophilus]|uniref:Glucose/arabinose dehydrogenase, beta-propeller fold n=1 Tax=Dyadobacter psychrophilus TaxID=651661 RepID=A0A1T5DRZ2_9BACT|nr:PQQ-dependent sugar dehydrogenase [Dyadobacter psychrophilus]SKB74441.1 Glucose/arabinose dehydrogenase, beta-propeller fold [Dyadobacter psychrophilus]